MCPEGLRAETSLYSVDQAVLWCIPFETGALFGTLTIITNSGIRSWWKTARARGFNAFECIDGRAKFSFTWRNSLSHVTDTSHFIHKMCTTGCGTIKNRGELFLPLLHLLFTVYSRQLMSFTGWSNDLRLHAIPFVMQYTLLRSFRFVASSASRTSAITNFLVSWPVILDFSGFRTV